MNILFVCEGFDKQNIRAQPWKHVYEVASRLQKRGNKVTIITELTSNNIEDEYVGELFTIKVRKKGLLIEKADLIQALKGDYDIVDWTGSGAASAVNFLGLKNFDKKIVWTIHGGITKYSDFKNLKIQDFPQLRMFWSNFLFSISNNFFTKKAMAAPNVKSIVTLSKRLEINIEKLNKGKKIKTIYSGVDIERFSPQKPAEIEAFKNELGLCSDLPIVLYYGPLTPFRGVDVLVDAIPLISAKNNVNFIFLGRTSKLDHRSTILKNRILSEKNAHLIEGALDLNLLIKYLNVADIIVLPFRFWPFIECPLTVLESMALGKPVITTAIGAIPEILKNEKTGLIIRPSAKEIASNVNRLLKDKEFSEKLGMNARSFVKMFHSWDEVVDQTLEVYADS
jgi:phosphatidyl-myo-inositol dimannoside synthase